MRDCRNANFRDCHTPDKLSSPNPAGRVRTMSKGPHITVEGAGIAGLCAACELAMRGVRVTVVDSNHHAGGDVHVIRDRRFSFDTGPVVITLPEMVAELFAKAGRDAADYFRLFELDPQPRFWFEDGVVLNLNRDPAAFGRMLDQQFPITRPGAEWLNFMAYCRWEVPQSWLARQMDPTMVRTARSVVKDKYVKRISEYFAGDLREWGTWDVARERARFGMWYPMGGMREVVKGLERLASELGVQFIYGVPSHTRVAQSKNPKEFLTAEVDANPQNVLRSNKAEMPRKFRKIAFFLGLSKRYEHLTFLNVFLSKDIEEETHALIARGEHAQDMTIEVVSPCIIDPGHAPIGGDAMRVTVRTPLPRGGEKWGGPAGLTAMYRAAIFKKLKRFGMEDLESRIVAEYVLTPPDRAKWCTPAGETTDIADAVEYGRMEEQFALARCGTTTTLKV